MDIGAKMASVIVTVEVAVVVVVVVVVSCLLCDVC